MLSSNQGHISMAAMNTVAEVLNKLLVVGITDTGMIVRTVLIGLGVFDEDLSELTRRF